MDDRPRQIAVFDVCDTLFAANTTVGFLRFYAGRINDDTVARGLERWGSRSSPAFYLGALTDRIAGWDLARTRLISSLRGHSRAKLRAAAEEYVTGELMRHIIEPVHVRLREHLGHGDRIILASSSLDVVIAAVARSFGVEWIASELGFAGNQCTGKLLNDLTGRKPAAISAMVGSDAHIHVYTDNRSDQGLLRMAGRCTIILPAGSNIGRWAGEDCEYLSL